MGNLTNTLELKQSACDSGSIFRTTSDTEVILQLVARSQKSTVIEKLSDALSTIKGAYSLVILTEDKLIGVKDPFGIDHWYWVEK